MRDLGFSFLQLLYLIRTETLVSCTFNNINLLFEHEGVEPDQLQAEDQPHWSHRLSEHRDHVTRRLPLRFRRQGRQGMSA